MRVGCIPVFSLLFGGLAASAPAAAVAQSAPSATVEYAAAAGSTDDPSTPQHQLEFHPLLDMPRDEGFVTELLLMRAHIRVGMDLHRAGVQDQAAAHCSHPLDEIYDDLALQLDDRGLPPFGAELRELTDRLRAGASLDDVAVAADKALAAIDATLDAVDAGRRQAPDFVVTVATALLRAAQQDYEGSLGEGRVTNPVEYEDSWAFFQEARALLAGANVHLAERNPAALADLNKQLGKLELLWPTMLPPQQIFADATYLRPILDSIESLQRRFQ